jgi:zona occludens toxin (predicted ATPase)
MIHLICGATGSGKTITAVDMMYKRWKAGATIWTNTPLLFSITNERVERYDQLAELTHLKNGIIFIDEAQKLFSARAWPLLPITFCDKLAQHRHDGIDIITTTPDLAGIDVYFRRLIHKLYITENLIRIPQDEHLHPFFQLIRIHQKKRNFDTLSGSIIWKDASKWPKFRVISHLFTKKLYDTYAQTRLSRFIISLNKDNKVWKLSIISREAATKRK